VAASFIFRSEEFRVKDLGKNNRQQAIGNRVWGIGYRVSDFKPKRRRKS
jgi:hypothetical protein